MYIHRYRKQTYRHITSIIDSLADVTVDRFCGCKMRIKNNLNNWIKHYCDHVDIKQYCTTWGTRPILHINKNLFSYNWSCFDQCWISNVSLTVPKWRRVCIEFSHARLRRLETTQPGVKSDNRCRASAPRRYCIDGENNLHVYRWPSCIDSVTNDRYYWVSLVFDRTGQAAPIRISCQRRINDRKIEMVIACVTVEALTFVRKDKHGLKTFTSR